MKTITKISIREMKAVDKLAEWVAMNPKPSEDTIKDSDELAAAIVIHEDRYDNMEKRYCKSCPDTLNLLQNIGYFVMEVERVRMQNKLTDLQIALKRQSSEIGKLLEREDIIVE